MSTIPPFTMTGAAPPPHVLQTYLDRSAALHNHLCPRQVLGVRLGLRGLQALGLLDEQYQGTYQNRDKRVLAFAETDGCGLDGIAVATYCHVGRRTMRVVDFGKVAAVLVDTHTSPHTAVRVSPHPQARDLVSQYAPHAESRWHAYLEAYQIMPDEALVVVQPVTMRVSVEALISRPGARAICDECGEEIMNEREIHDDHGRVLCRYCAGQKYYQAQL